MGLDITAYRKLTKLDATFDADSGEVIDAKTRQPIQNYLRVFDNQDFPGRAEGLEHGGIYAYESADDSFCMSYNGYNLWREALAKMAGYPETEYQSYRGPKRSHAAACWHGAPGPFHELINFSDCEGTIGPVVAARLAKDFTEFDAQARSVSHTCFYQQYDILRRMSEMAADGGALRFR